MRLDIRVARDNPEQSRSVWQKLIEAGQVAVNGTVQRSVKFDVVDDDDVTAIAPDAPDHL